MADACIATKGRDVKLTLRLLTGTSRRLKRHALIVLQHQTLQDLLDVLLLV